MLTEVTVTDLTPGSYGSSPKDMPLLVGILIGIFGVLLLANSLRIKRQLVERQVQVTESGELIRLGKYLAVIVVIPILVPLIGFYTTIVIGLLAIMALSKVKKILIYVFSAIGIILAVFLFLEKISQVRLPSGLFI